MIFPQALKAWQTPEFKDVLKEEIERLDPSLLPLQQGLSQSSYVGDGKFSVMMIRISDESNFIYIKAGIFYGGVIAGCNCADDPTPVDEQPEYCEVEFIINKLTAETSVKLLSD